MREYKLAIFLDVRSWKHVVELRKAEGDYYAKNTRIVTKVEVEILVHREGDRIVVKCDIDLRSRISDDVVLHSSEDFLHVTCTV